MGTKQRLAVRLAPGCLLALLAGWTAPPCAAAERALPPGDEYIVVFAETVSGDALARVAADLVGRHGGTAGHLYREGFRGFAARLPPLSAAGMRRDPRVAGLEALAGDSLPPAEPDALKEPARAPAASGERLPFAPGTPPKLRRVLTPAADRYLVVLAGAVAPADVESVAERLVREHGGQRGAVEAAAFRAQMPESSARAMSRDPAVAYVEEQSIAEPMDPKGMRPAPRNLPGERLRRVARPVRDRYRVTLRPGVPAEHLGATVEELLRAYEGRRHAERADDPRVILVEMAEPAARALSDDFRVESVEEQAATSHAAAGTR